MRLAAGTCWHFTACATERTRTPGRKRRVQVRTRTDPIQDHLLLLGGPEAAGSARATGPSFSFRPWVSRRALVAPRALRDHDLTAMDEARRIERFVTRLSRHQRGAAAVATMIRTGLVAACSWVLTAWLVPHQGSLILALGSAFVVISGLVRYATTKLELVASDRALELSDRLPTWQSARSRRPGDAMVGWLEAELSVRVVGMPNERVRRVFPVRLGWMRYLVPVVVVLLLLQLFTPLAPPGDLGLLLGGGGTNTGGDSAGEGSSRKAPAHGSGNSGAASRRSPPSRPESVASRPEPASEPRVAETLPVVTMKPRDEFVVPELVREGPTRKALAPLAELDVAPAGGAAGASSSTAAALDPSRSDPAAYRRAIEEALARRHVPEVERPFVRRYFEEFAQRAR